MSDDGYYMLDDDYDDFEDLFYNDEGEINLADDLAEHTLPSPIYAADPSQETLNGYSDWEYYSDDYYDDDPNILRATPQDGSRGREGTSKAPNGSGRGKKRKLAAVNDIPALSLDGHSKHDSGSLSPKIEGTVWRTVSTDTENKYLYSPGKGERIGLFGDWRDVFRNSQPFRDFGQNSSLSIRKRAKRVIDRTARPFSVEHLSPTRATNGAKEGSDIEEVESDQSRSTKRRRISHPRNSQYAPTHKIVVEIPRSRSSERQKAEKGGTRFPQLPNNKKRKACDEEIADSCDEDSEPRAKRVTSKKVRFAARSTTTRKTRKKGK